MPDLDRAARDVPVGVEAVVGSVHDGLLFPLPRGARRAALPPPKEIYLYVCTSLRSPVLGLHESELHTDRSDCRGFLAK